MTMQAFVSRLGSMRTTTTRNRLVVLNSNKEVDAMDAAGSVMRWSR